VICFLEVSGSLSSVLRLSVGLSSLSHICGFMLALVYARIFTPWKSFGQPC
jgi:hypothetical protein